MTDMLPITTYAIIVAATLAAMATLFALDRRKLQAAESDTDKKKLRRRLRGWLGIAGLTLALYPVMYGNSLLEPRSAPADYLDLAIGFAGLGVILTGVVKFSEPEPPPKTEAENPPPDDDPIAGES